MKEEKQKSPAADDSKKMDRRDFLQGAATLPVLGLFGYAVTTSEKPGKKN